MINPLDLTGKNILVTGASSGIGRDTAIILSKLGAKLILNGRNYDALIETKNNLERSDHIVEAFDLRNTDEIKSWLKKIAKNAGLLSGLVHCAGIQQLYPIKLFNKSKAEEIININLVSAIALISAFSQCDVHLENSSIVLVSSVMGLVGQPGRVAYAATKSGLIGVTKCAALELARDKIRVNCVSPGFVLTKMTKEVKDILSDKQYEQIISMHPLGIGTTIDVAYSIAFLLSDASKWMTGANIVVDGGYSAQ